MIKFWCALLLEVMLPDHLALSIPFGINADKPTIQEIFYNFTAFLKAHTPNLEAKVQIRWTRFRVVDIVLCSDNSPRLATIDLAFDGLAFLLHLRKMLDNVVDEVLGLHTKIRQRVKRKRAMLRVGIPARTDSEIIAEHL